MRTFDPWEGDAYRTSGLNGLRVLVLGESHYGKPVELLPTFTQGVVRSLGIDSRHRFFTATAKLLLNTPPGIPLTDCARASFWRRVAFYNYIQEFVGTVPRTRPTKEMWQQAGNYLPAVVAELNPQLMLVLGKALASWLPDLPANLKVCRVPHPSSFGFKLGRWQQEVEGALAECSVGGI
jgi:hypothetical protein